MAALAKRFLKYEDILFVCRNIISLQIVLDCFFVKLPPPSLNTDGLYGQKIFVWE